MNYAANESWWWKGTTNYTRSNAVVIPIGNCPKYVRLSFGAYYKGTWGEYGSGNWLFWMDDIEIWDGIPGVPQNNPLNITLTTPSGCPYTTTSP
jgi:hypothetical protein